MAASVCERNSGTHTTDRFDLDEFIRGIREYYETVVKNETPEESKRILIETGVMDEDGNFIVRHTGGWG